MFYEFVFGFVFKIEIQKHLEENDRKTFCEFFVISRSIKNKSDSLEEPGCILV